MDKKTQDLARQEIMHHLEQVTIHLIHLHVVLDLVGGSGAEEWIPHMLSALNTVAEYYQQDTWE